MPFYDDDSNDSASLDRMLHNNYESKFQLKLLIKMIMFLKLKQEREEYLIRILMVLAQFSWLSRSLRLNKESLEIIIKLVSSF
jgi:hypothetical protein